MAKQQSDNIEDRFREAAENISFPPNEEAWSRMEALLDKDKSRRPALIWWFVLLAGLLAGAGIFSYVTNNDSRNVRKINVTANEKAGRGIVKGPAPEEQKDKRPSENMRGDESFEGRSKQTLTQSGSDKADINPEKRGEAVAKLNDSTGMFQGTDRAGAGIGKLKAADGRNPSANAGKKPAKIENRRSSSTARHQLAKSRNRRPSANDASIVKTSGDRPRSASEDRKQTTTGEQHEDDLLQMTVRADSAISSPGKNRLANSASDSSKIAGSADSTGQMVPQPVIKDASTKQSSAPARVTASSKKWKLENGLSFSVGTRIDATDLHHITLTQFSQLAGATIGYRFSNRLSVQTGIFVQRAKYYAGPEDYYVKPGTYLSMYRISKIDAVCQIYEIPLTLRYDILVGKGLRVYATSGLQSFYLKKESYRYHATGSSGYRQFDSTYSANKNFLSSAWLSAGVEKKISPSFSILAEPYAKLPVSGIGAGKVKLYSGGIQFMLRYQPQSNKTIVNRK